MNSIITDCSENYILQSSFAEGELSLCLRVFHQEEGSVTFYKQTFDNECLTEQQEEVFGDVESMWKICFRKRKNYTISDNGLIKIGYTIQFEDDEIHKSTILHLKKQELASDDEWKSVYGNLAISKRREIALENKLEELKRKILKFNKLIIPIESEYNQRFKFQKSCAELISGDNTMLVLDTDIVDSEKFQFCVRIHNRYYSLNFGLISDSFVKNQNAEVSEETVYCSLDENGEYKVNGKVVQKFDPFQKRLTMKVDKSKGTLIINYVSNQTGLMKDFEKNLGDLQNQKRIYPFICFKRASDLVEVVLK